MFTISKWPFCYAFIQCAPAAKFKIHQLAQYIIQKIILAVCEEQIYILLGYCNKVQTHLETTHLQVLKRLFWTKTPVLLGFNVNM